MTDIDRLLSDLQSAINARVDAEKNLVVAEQLAQATRAKVNELLRQMRELTKD